MLAKKTIMCYNGSMNKTFVNQVDEMLNSIDFAAIWPGFASCGLTSAQELPDMQEDAQRAASHLVRGMFRTFRQKQGDTREPDEAAILNYPHDLDNYQLKLAENHYLAKAVTDNSIMDLQQFVVLREARRRIIGETMKQEQRAETMEGLTEYAGLAALNQMSRAKFMEEVQGHLAVLRSPRHLFNVRHVSKSVGCLLCFALKSLNVDFYHDLSDSRTIYDFIPREPSEVEIIFNETR